MDWWVRGTIEKLKKIEALAELNKELEELDETNIKEASD